MLVGHSQKDAYASTALFDVYGTDNSFVQRKTISLLVPGSLEMSIPPLRNLSSKCFLVWFGNLEWTYVKTHGLPCNKQQTIKKSKVNQFTDETSGHLGCFTIPRPSSEGVLGITPKTVSMPVNAAKILITVEPIPFGLVQISQRW